MNTYTTPTGIKVLLPQVPIGAPLFINRAWAEDKHNSEFWLALEMKKHFSLEKVLKGGFSILGTCWREGGKLICEGFDPLTLGFKPVRKDMDDPYWTPSKSCTEVMDSWLLSIGEKIKEGHKIVVIKVE